jgi:uncharacterized SAM-binding protein YcdF (DUF218 family)
MHSAHGTSKKSTTSPSRLFFRILGTLALLGTTTGLVILLGAGKWLAREDPLEEATAIAVLSGNSPIRALEAARLYHDGYAKEIWLTHPRAHADVLNVLGIYYPRESDFNVWVLREQGVPAKAIHVLDSPIANTAEELDVISAALQAAGGQRVIVVTNRAHTQRVHILWNMYFGSRGQLIAHAISNDDFDASHWWKTSGGRAQTNHEFFGIMNAWAGLPVQRVPHPTDAILAPTIR